MHWSGLNRISEAILLTKEPLLIDAIVRKSKPMSLPSPAFAGDSAAVEALFESWMPLLHRRARRLLRNREDSEDAMQDALLLAFRNLGQFEGRSQFATWMHTIMANTARNLIRRQKVRPMASYAIVEDSNGAKEPFTVQLPCSDSNPEREYQRKESAQTVSRILAALPPRARRMMRMYEIEGRDTKEIAEELGVRVGTVKSQLHRARQMLKSSVGTTKRYVRNGTRLRAAVLGRAGATIKRAGRIRTIRACAAPQAQRRFVQH
jgi:RNA polymerase sigma-70 factor, ECF subfamily